MDGIHDPGARAWISKPVAAAQYFSEYKERVHKEKPIKDMSDLKPKWLKAVMGLEDQEMLESVEQVMRLESLTLKEEVEPMQICDPIRESIHGATIPKFYKTAIPREACTRLRTLALQSAWLASSDPSNVSKLRSKRKRQSKHDNDHWFQAEKPRRKNTNWDLTDRAVVYYIRIYRPFRQLDQEAESKRQLRYCQELWLLGHHTLADLRDKITCTADMHLVGPQQVDMVGRPATRASDLYPSAMIYMEGTFYIDRRAADHKDYSAVVRQWAEEDPRRGAGPFTTANMEETRLDSLTVRLGYPYLYQHQGNHEHLFSVVDVRLVGPEDPQSPLEYPVLRSVGSQQSKYCNVCQTDIAMWVTRNNHRVPESPYFFCGLCYKDFNFVDKKRVDKGGFEALRFFDVNVA